MGYKVGDRIRFLTPVFQKGKETVVTYVGDDYIIVACDQYAYAMQIEPVAPPIQVGDFVRVKPGRIGAGEYGLVLTMYADVGVEFARPSDERHSCSGLTKNGHGYRYNPADLEIANDGT